MGYIVGSTSTLAKLAARIDASLGYPRDGVNAGGGVFATAAQGRTLRYDQAYYDAGLQAWAYPTDTVSAPMFDAVKKTCSDAEKAGTATADEKAIASLTETKVAVGGGGK